MGVWNVTGRNVTEQLAYAPEHRWSATCTAAYKIDLKEKG